MQHLQDLPPEAFELLLADAVDGAQVFQGARIAAGHLHGLAVGQDHVPRHAIGKRPVLAPVEDAQVAGPLHLVQLVQQPAEGFLLRAPLLAVARAVGRHRVHRPLQRPQLEHHRPVRAAAVFEEAGLVRQHLMVPERRLQHFVGKQAQLWVEGNGQYAQHKKIAAKATPWTLSFFLSRTGVIVTPLAACCPRPVSLLRWLDLCPGHRPLPLFDAVKAKG